MFTGKIGWTRRYCKVDWVNIDSLRRNTSRKRGRYLEKEKKERKEKDFHEGRFFLFLFVSVVRSLNRQGKDLKKNETTK